MKVFVVFTLSRQVEGELVFLKPEMGFLQASKADELSAELKKKYNTPDGRPQVMKISTPQGEADCVSVAAPFEIEIPDLEIK